MNAQELDSSTKEKSPNFKISMTSDEYYNRNKSFEYKVVYYCMIGFVITLLLGVIL
jgi:hypothetical protein